MTDRIGDLARELLGTRGGRRSTPTPGSPAAGRRLCAADPAREGPARDLDAGLQTEVRMRG
ncbi:hypothetical protein GCM10010493_34480 [Streptomyces lavendulae subsp. grasserius]